MVADTRHPRSAHVFIVFYALCHIVFAPVESGEVERKLPTLTSSKADLTTHMIKDSNNIPEIEMQALQDLFTATDGANWEFGQYPGNPWNFSAIANPCLDFWEGVTCSNIALDSSLHVVDLQLPYYYLNGTIPDTIGNLAQLVNLSLTGNFFSTGSLPASIGNLIQLQVLKISSSHLLGSIPASIGNMTSLATLQLNHNYITGTVPDSICALSRMEILAVEECRLYGSLPDCIGRLTQTQYISFESNALTGTLPDSLGALTNLTILDVSANKMRGTVPNNFCALSKMQQLFLFQNAFHGRVLRCIANMVSLTDLDISFNAFSGSIPAAIGQLQLLTTLLLYKNELTGTIPPSLTQLPLLSQLTLDANLLTGTIPADIFGTLGIEYFSATANLLSGPLPPSLGLSENLTQILVGENCLSGTLPDAFESLTLLNAFLAYENFFSGAVPASLLNLPLLALELGSNMLTGSFPAVQDANNSKLFYLDCADNYLTGPYPGIFGPSANVGYLNLSSNWFSGPLPASISNMGDVNFLYLQNNLFSATLPDVWSNLASLSYLFLDSNLFTGSISASLGMVPYLRSVNLSQNFFTGTIPRTLSNAQGLNVLLLQQNQLTGNLEGLFDPSVQKLIATIQVSDNQLTGTLPEELFQLVGLQVFAAVTNCFTGSIPISLCISGSLVTLALDGLQSATSCQRRLFPAALEGSVVANSLYSIRSPLVGGVPSCLFGMSNLTTLHLSGNGLTGGFSDNLTISSALTDLSLSHNQLTGSIPASILEHSWTNLDLSYNRFGGTLQDSQPAAALPNTSLSLGNNRLSGRIPAALVQMANVDILQSNLFSCRADRSDLPHHDPNEGKFDCASVVLDETLYAWLSAISAGAVLVVMLRYGGGRLGEWRQAALAQVKLWWSAASAERAPHCRSVCLFVTAIVRIAVACCAYALVVLLPMYAVCSALYGTYAHQYAWTVSAAYLSGRVAFVWECSCLVLLIGCAAACAIVHTVKFVQVVKVPQVSIGAGPGDQKREKTALAVYALTIALNFSVVVGVNTAYVIIALNENGKALTLAQIALALFKVAFNSVCSPVLMRWLSQSVLGRQPSAAGFITVQLFVSMVNNILVPCLVVSIISPDCFYNIFKTASVVDAYFTYPGRCTTYDPYSRSLYGCKSEETLTAQTSYSPPFNYSYQCSSSFITYYAPAYVIMCIIAGLALPLAQLLLQWLHGRAVRGTRWFALLDAVLPRILKPMTADASEASAASSSPYLPYFDASQHLITLLTYLALLLTFGAVFPPLAVCFAVTMLCMAGFTRLKVGRFLFNAHAQGLAGCAAAVEQECGGVGGTGLLRRSVGMVVSFSCLFYTLFLFDTLGDAEGLSGAYWVLIVLPLLVAVGALVSHFALWPRVLTVKLPGEADATSAAVELQTLSPFAPGGAHSTV